MNQIMIYVLLIFSFLIPSALAQQIGPREIKEFNVTPWNTNNIIDYQFVYHFGN